MIHKQDILDMVSHVTKRSHRLKPWRKMYPEREWFFILVLLLVLLVGALFINLSRFRYYQHIEENLPPSNVKVVDYEVEAMEKVLRYYEAKDKEFNLLKNNLTPAPVVEVASSTADVIEGGE